MTTTANRTRTNDLQLNSWNVRSLSEPGSLEALLVELRHYRCNITALQETKWKGSVVSEEKGFAIFSSGCRTRAEFSATSFVVDAKWKGNVIGWIPIHGRLRVLRVKGKFFNYSIINAHAPHNERDEETKESFYIGGARATTSKSSLVI